MIRTRITSLLATLAVAAVPTIAFATPAATSSAATCPPGWGSLLEATAWSSHGRLTNVRTGRHACFDRLVVDVNGQPASGYRVGYVRAVTMDGSGHAVPLRGGARLQIVVHAPAYDADTGKATYEPENARELTDVAGYRTFRQVAFAGSFEGQTTIGLGVRARLPFRVFTLTGPGHASRVVIDVAHHW